MGKAFRTLLVPVTGLLLCACHAPQNDHVRSLAGPWAFHPGDDPGWAAAGFDDSQWARIQVPLSWGVQGYQDVSGFAWYRLRVDPDWPADQPLGVTIGKIDAAYELYADGVKLGGVGQFPPEPREEYDRHATYVLPFSNEPRASTLALRVWRPAGRHPGEAGPTGGPFEIGPLVAVIARTNLADVDRVVLASIFLATALYMFGLWLLRPKAKEYGWFAALALAAGVYCFLGTQWKYTLFSDFLGMKKTEHFLLYVTPILLFQFVWAYLARPRPLWFRLLQIPFALGGLAVLLIPGLTTALALLPALEIYAAVATALCLGWLGFWAYRGDRDAVTVGVGMIAMTIAMTRDTLIDHGSIAGPTAAAYGFSVMVVLLAVSLAIRFHHAVEGLDEISRELEKRVWQRTAELSHAYRRMEDLALRDALTNLLNRRSIVERASAGLALACRRRSPYGVALLDVDHFKIINDTYGHGTGDRVLVAVAEALAAKVRVSDDVARWGGEEFLVLLPDSDSPSACQACERLRAAVEDIVVFDEDHGPIRVTVSVGVASVEAYGGEPALFEDLMRSADDALYEAKEDGRNRIQAAPRRSRTAGGTFGSEKKSGRIE